jgi:osmoprotectant transport system permease protein
LARSCSRTARTAAFKAQHKQGLGNTGILFEALKSGGVDVYPDYTGTIGRELLKSDASDLDSLNRGLAPLGLGVAVPLGFENTYALAMSDAKAQPLNAVTIGDLAKQPKLRFGLSHEFFESQRRLAGIAARI